MRDPHRRCAQEIYGGEAELICKAEEPPAEAFGWPYEPYRPAASRNIPERAPNPVRVATAAERSVGWYAEL